MIWLEKSQLDTQMLVDQLVDFENTADTPGTTFIQVDR
jgi:hypothetical protein